MYCRGYIGIVPFRPVDACAIVSGAEQGIAIDNTSNQFQTVAVRGFVVDKRD
jgi:hypothetical protein